LKALASKKAITKVQAAILIAVVIVVAVAGTLAYFWTRPPPPVKPIKIGLLLDLTGPLAAYGYSHEKVISAAVRKVNAEGGIAGRPVETYIEDTETKVATATLRMRKLIEHWGVDFVLGPNHSGIAIAIAPIAKELKTITFVTADATDYTGVKGNRYVFRFYSNVRQQGVLLGEWAARELGKKWATVVVDYAWGWSWEEEFTKYVTEAGGTVLKAIRAPMGTKDFMPYLVLIPEEVEAVQIAFFGTDLLSILRDLHTLRPGINKLIATYGLTGIRSEDLGDAGKGIYIATPFPRRLASFDTPYTRAFREAVGMDPEGSEVGNPAQVYAHHANYANWETIFALKRAIEETGWESREDHPELIKALEGMEFKESYEFPQGDKFIRAEDHQAFMKHFIEKFEDGKMVVIAETPVEAGLYPPEVDFTKEPF
jgi:branched-chain amino acid transport system substrate-binding protein